MQKKVYIVLHTLSIGGAERHASSIANYFSDNGYDVTIILLDNNEVAYSLSSNVQVLSLREIDSSTEKTPRFTERLIIKTYNSLSKKRYNYYDRFLYYKIRYIDKLSVCFDEQKDIANSIVISFMTIPNTCTSFLQKKYRYKLILGEFTSPQLEFPQDAPENEMKKKYYVNADAFVFQTDEQQSFYSFLPNVGKCIIPNPIEKIEVEPYVGSRKKEIVNFCKHVKAKNLPLLIEAFSKLLKRFPEYTLTIYGDGPTRKETEESIRKNDVQNAVNLKPYEKEVLKKVRDCAMFVSSSDREGISNSMLEAMAIGLPVICTDCPAGGARMMIKPYENGILVPVRDPEAMYQAMKYMIEHPDEAEEMGRKAVEVRQTLEKNKILQQWLSFIESI